MNLEYGATCKIRHLKQDDFFMRGRWLYRMTGERKAQRYLILSDKTIAPHKSGERIVDLRSNVTLVLLPKQCEILG